ncbi:MAG TPA: hypothetical protein VFN87_05285 [Solirubrobacteraceae bacterium]|nr:hypothetical protein [Solirubrobacteraceae bacterium]
MAQTTSKAGRSATAPAGTRSRAAAGGRSVKAPAGARDRSAARGPKTMVGRTTELSDEVLDSVEKGQRAAIEAVRKFIDTVDQALPARGEGPSRRQEIVDSAMEMADRLVHTQYEFIRKVIDSASKSAGSSAGKK